MSDSACVQFTAAIARAGDLDVQKSVVSRSALRTTRIDNRNKIMTKVDEQFIKKLKTDNLKLTVHWDGKIMSNTTNNGDENILIDRLPVVVTGKGVEKTLGVPKLQSGLFILSTLNH